MLPYTPWPLVRYYLPEIFIISVILDTAILRSNIARQTLPVIASRRGSLFSKRPLLMRRRERRKTSTGRLGTRSRKTVSDVDASVIPTSWMLRASREAAWINGLPWPADGRLLSRWLFFMRSYFRFVVYIPIFQHGSNTMGSIRVAFLAVLYSLAWMAAFW